jgi:hypothetical protein
MDNLITLWISAASAQLDKLDLSEEQNDAIVELFDLCSENAEKAFEVICEILRRKPREDIVGYLGAGPLEDLLIKNCEYVDIVIERSDTVKLLMNCLEVVNIDTEDCAEASTNHDYIAKGRW